MYVVTGGAGFIGSNIIAAMEKRGIGPIVVVDLLRNSNKWKNISKRELTEVIEPKSLFDFLNKNSNKVSAIIHMGAISSTLENDVDLLLKVNFSLSKNIWNWCTKNRVSFIYASSAATYGDGSQGFDDNGSVDYLEKLKPLNAYGWSKHLFDRRIARSIEKEELLPPQWVGLKFFNVYGPNELHKAEMASVVSKVYPFASRGEAFQLFKSHDNRFKDGGQLRDFIWVGDCVDIILWFLEHDGKSGLFNCGTGNPRSFLDLVETVYKTLEKKPLVNFIDTPESIKKNYQYYTKAEMQRLRDSGYNNPMTTLEDGIANYLNNYLNTNDQFR